MNASFKQKQFFDSILQDKMAISPEIKINTIATSGRRWGAYAYAYMARIKGVIEQDFPMLKKYIEGNLENWIETAIRRHPSTFIDIGELTKNFLHYLEEEGLEKELDLANFEFEYAKAFDHKKINSVLLDKIQQTPEDEMVSLKCVLNPSIVIIESYFQGLDYKKPKYDRAKLSTYLIYSFDYRRRVKSLDEKELALFDALREGCSIAALSDRVDESVLSSIFVWVKDGVLIDLIKEEK